MPVASAPVARTVAPAHLQTWTTAPAPGPGIAVLGLVLALLIIFVWRIGGVILVIDADHGVHTGDLLALPLLLPALSSLRRWYASAA